MYHKIQRGQENQAYEEKSREVKELKMGKYVPLAHTSYSYLLSSLIFLELIISVS